MEQTRHVEIQDGLTTNEIIILLIQQRKVIYFVIPPAGELSSLIGFRPSHFSQVGRHQGSVSLNFVRQRISYVLSYANRGLQKAFHLCLFRKNFRTNFLNSCVNIHVRLGQGCRRSENFRKCHGGDVQVCRRFRPQNQTF